MAGLELLLKELNPKHDMDKAEIALRPLSSHDNEPLKKAILEMSKTAGCRMYYLVKPFVRGGLIGAGIGSVAGAVSGENVGQYASAGALIGMVADMAQMYPRLFYHGVRTYAREIKKLFQNS